MCYCRQKQKLFLVCLRKSPFYSHTYKPVKKYHFWHKHLCFSMLCRFSLWFNFKNSSSYWTFIIITWYNIPFNLKVIKMHFTSQFSVCKSWWINWNKGIFFISFQCIYRFLMSFNSIHIFLFIPWLLVMPVPPSSFFCLI